MPDRSRRHALQTVAAAGALALAGCSARNSSNDGPPVRHDRITEFEATAARNDDGDPLFVAGDDGTEQEADLAARFPEMHPVTDEEDLQQFRFGDGAGAADLEAFVTATDFESASVFLLQSSIGDCYVPRLAEVVREGDGVDVDVCRALRPADVECDADARDAFAVAIRLPFAEFDGVGGSGIGDCGDHPTLPLTDRGDAT